MKEKFTKSVAFLMLAWYCVCLVGFDVHTCFRSGESIVSSLLVGAVPVMGVNILSGRAGSNDIEKNHIVGTAGRPRTNGQIRRPGR